MGGQELITRLFENILFLFQHASFSNRVPLVCRVPLLQQGPVGVPLLLPFPHRVPLVCRVPLLQQGPVGVPLLLPFPTEYLWSAEYLCFSRVPAGVPLLLSTHSLTHTHSHTHTRTHTLAHSREHTHPHTLSGSRDPKLGSLGSCLSLHRSGHPDLIGVSVRSGQSHLWKGETHASRRLESGVWWARDPAEPVAGANQGTAETADRTRTGTGPTPTLTGRQGTQS